MTRLKDSFEGSYNLRQIVQVENDENQFIEFLEVRFLIFIHYLRGASSSTQN